MFRDGATLATTAVAVSALQTRPAWAAPSSAEWSASYSGRKSIGETKRWEPGAPDKDYTPVNTPGGATLPFRIVDGVKVFHLVAEEVEHEFAPGLQARCWGYNGRVHGPTLEAVEGDRVRVYVTNRLAAPTTVHWHGVFVPSGMDGVGGLSQRAIRPGETFVYEWTFRQFGTFMYHSHHDEMTQMAMGLMGMIVVHPRRLTPEYAVDRDFVIMLGEWSIPVGTRRPNPNEMTDFNVLTMNAKAFPGTTPLVCKTGDRVRIRLGNLSAMDNHPIHLHGYYFKVTATDGGRVPPAARAPETTVLVPTGSTREIEFIADEPGDWAMHCHMTHHVMNQMGHGIPNMIGVEPGKYDQGVRRLLPNYMTMGQTGMGEMADMGMQVPKNSIPMVGGKGPYDTITMGGMFTIVKVRDELHDDTSDPGWYQAPPGTVAMPAKPEDLKRDGVEV
jgi:FtsP/CotA-like multicopper oxidase with cupredoxin domain